MDASSRLQMVSLQRTRSWLGRPRSVVSCHRLCFHSISGAGYAPSAQGGLRVSLGAHLARVRCSGLEQLAVMVLCFAATSMSCLETRSRFASTMASCIPKKVLPAGALPTPSHMLVAGAGRVALRVHNSAPTASSAATSVPATMPLFFQLNGYGSSFPLCLGLT
jgi:hypothetical protein